MSELASESMGTVPYLKEGDAQRGLCMRRQEWLLARLLAVGQRAVRCSRSVAGFSELVAAPTARAGLRPTVASRNEHRPAAHHSQPGLCITLTVSELHH